jgi:hypothetical protein
MKTRIMSTFTLMLCLILNQAEAATLNLSITNMSSYDFGIAYELNSTNADVKSTHPKELLSNSESTSLTILSDDNKTTGKITLSDKQKHVINILIDSAQNIRYEKNTEQLKLSIMNSVDSTSIVINNT